MTGLRSAILALATTIAIATGAQAATVASVNVPVLTFNGIIHEIDQAGYYTLDFSGEGQLGVPTYLGFAGYVFDEINGGLLELLKVLGDGFSVVKGTSISLGYLTVGTDFAAGLLSAGSTTMSLVRIDDPVPAPVPLPATLPLLAAAMGAVGLAARRRRRG